MVTATEVRRAQYARPAREVRKVIGHPEVRAVTDGGFRVAGYASITDAPYEVEDWLGSYTETIERGAFGKALRESDDVRFLVNHDGIPLARTRSATLTLREIVKPEDDPQSMGQTGLWCEAEIDGASPLAQTVRSAMARGDLDQMSFAFQATRQEWNDDYTERILREVRLFDVSIVTYPANPATSMSLEGKSARLAGVAARMAGERKLTDPDDVALISNLLGVLAAIDSIVDVAQESTSDYLGVENPDHDEPADESPADEADEGERSAEDPNVTERALALARARAHRA